MNEHLKQCFADGFALLFNDKLFEPVSDDLSMKFLSGADLHIPNL